MLISMKEMLKLVQKRGHAAGAFHAFNLEQIQGVIEAAVEEQVPVIICLDEPGAMYAGMGAFMAMASELAREVPVPVAILLDHIHDPDLIANGMSLGFSGFLVDRRDEPLEDSISKLTVLKTEVMTEDTFFEVGVKIGGEDGAINLQHAPIIWEKVQPDSICISINKGDRSHPSSETLSLLTKTITSLNCPLSLAGVGRWSASAIKNAIKPNIWKISAATRLNRAFTQGLKKYLESDPDRINPRSYLASARESYTNEVKACIRLFASA